jgi:hypothetical protein
MTALVLFKLWLVSAQTIFAIGGSGGARHDDQLFINLAANLLAGRWLGSYSQFTLMKGPMYSLFIAGVFLSGIPLFAAQQLIYCASCWLLECAIRPLVSNVWPRFALFAVLLFNPVTYDARGNARLLRQDIIPGLVLAIVAGFIAMHARQSRPRSRSAPWAILSGVTLAAFWLTREESLWLLPCLVPIWGMTAFTVWRSRQRDRIARIFVLLVPAGIWAACLVIVASINLAYYGIFTTCEFRHADFAAAYGALLRVDPAQWRPYIHVPHESRERLYAISPAFAELRPHLEGPIGKAYAVPSEALTHIPVSELEIAGGWFVWALRDAVCAAGHCSNGREAMAFYRRLANEVNEACDNGLIEAGPRRTGFVPRLRREHLDLLPGAVRRVTKLFLTFDELGVSSPSSMGTPAELVQFADLTRGRLSPPSTGPQIPPTQQWLDRMRLHLLKKVSRTYHRLAPWAAGAASIGLLTTLLFAVPQRSMPYFGVLSLGSIAASGTLMAICTLSDVTAFNSIHTMYLTGAYGLYLLFMFTSWLSLAEVLGLRAMPASDIKEHDASLARP